MKSHFFLVPAFAILFVCLSNSASAQDKKGENWDKNHPRREQVNKRLKNQNERIDKKEAEGKMSKGEGNKLKKNDHEIRQEERDMAKQNGGHITKQEQKTLNQQENQNSKEIKNH